MWYQLGDLHYALVKAREVENRKLFLQQLVICLQRKDSTETSVLYVLRVFLRLLLKEIPRGSRPWQLWPLWLMSVANEGLPKASVRAVN